MAHIHPNKVGLALGAVFGAWHFLWAILVAIGWAQWIINFVFWMHFLTPSYTVTRFHLGVAMILIVVTTAVGYAIGYLLGVVWNWIHQNETPE